MKEADIEFGQWYAIEGEYEVTRWKVDSKVPVQPGKSRSRMYVLRRESPWPNEDRVDASKILMPWTDYERTGDYALSHFDTVQEKLDQQLRDAAITWHTLLIEYLGAVVTPHGRGSQRPFYSPSSMPGLPLTGDVEAFKQQILLGTLVTIPAKALVELANIPLPPLTSVESAIDQRDELLTTLRQQLLPALAHRLDKTLTDRDNDRHSRFDSESLSRYVESLKATGEPGPHDLLLRAAKLFPNLAFLRDLTQDPQFAYLIPHLTH